MTARMYYDADADPRALDGQTVAIIGYGSQGHAHALNLRDSGVDVVVGLAPGSKSRALAEAAGLRVEDVADAVKAADVIMIAVPDTAQKAVYDAEIEPNLRPGQLLMFAHGFNIRFARIQPPETIDVGMVAPKGPGHLLRSVYEQGGGVPALFAVEQDPSGTARARTLAYARGIGSTRAGRPRDDVQGGDRDRPVRRAGAAVRRRVGAGQGGVRDARRGRLPAGARVLRDDARAQADRRPDVPRRAQLHALQRVRHRGVRRLRLRPAGDRGRQGRDEGRPDRHPERVVRDALDRRPGRRRRGVPAAPRAGPEPPDRAGRRRPAGEDAVPQPGRRRGRPGAGRGSAAPAAVPAGEGAR